MDHLDELENQSIYILREAYKNFKNLAMLWSIGKDSTIMLWLARKAFFGHCPIPLVHIDTTYKIPAMIEYRDFYAKEWGLNLVVGKNQKALDEGMIKLIGKEIEDKYFNKLKEKFVNPDLCQEKGDELKRHKDRFSCEISIVSMSWQNTDRVMFSLKSSFAASQVSE